MAKKLDAEDVALIRAWCAGPGRHLPPAAQAHQLVQGVEGWWQNWAPVSYDTLYQIVKGENWPAVKPNAKRLAEWTARLQRLRSTQGLLRLFG